MILPEIILLLRIFFDILGFLLFQMNLSIALSTYMRNVGILMGIALILYIAFCKMANFIILILPIHEHGRLFHLLRPSLISFLRDLKFLSYRSFTSLVRVTPKYFILFVTKKYGMLHKFVCHPCTGAMLIFSVSFQF